MLKQKPKCVKQNDINPTQKLKNTKQQCKLSKTPKLTKNNLKIKTKQNQLMKTKTYHQTKNEFKKINNKHIEHYEKNANLKTNLIIRK